MYPTASTGSSPARDTILHRLGSGYASNKAPSVASIDEDIDEIHPQETGQYHEIQQPNRVSHVRFAEPSPSQSSQELDNNQHLSHDLNVKDSLADQMFDLCARAKAKDEELVGSYGD